MNSRSENTVMVDVGIMKAPAIEVRFSGKYTDPDSGHTFSGWHTFDANTHLCPAVTLIPESDECFFEIRDVKIGIGFHWERRENQSFYGSLRLLTDSHGITIINRLPVEKYLESVISSEMSANASLEFLKAHAVISRSWLLAQIINKAHGKGTGYQGEKTENEPSTDKSLTVDEEHIVWYDHSQHVDFDVCADDHCQRYQGIIRVSNKGAIEAVRATCGEVLTYNGELCDARFSKCCGGAFEKFDTCWEPVPHPYLTEGRDLIRETATPVPDLTDDATAKEWILGNPESFCNTQDSTVLSQVLNDYDLSTPDFYRWKVEYTQKEISELIKRRSGIDFGHIIDILPIQRGVSGRLVKAKIVGTKKVMIIGKELEIRRTLSPSHLYSSAFIVEKGYCNGVSNRIENTGDTTEPLPDRFTLHGAGWGHGVGLCQIGAAMMANRGYSYKEILSHYYPGTQIRKNNA